MEIITNAQYFSTRGYANDNAQCPMPNTSTTLSTSAQFPKWLVPLH
ncbi:hypothetical protein [Nostoc sp.]